MRAVIHSCWTAIKEPQDYEIVKQEVTSCGQATWAFNTLVAKKRK